MKIKFIVFVLLAFLTLAPAVQAAEKESTFDRVLRTGTIHCGYFQWPPFLTKDVNTGKVGGLSYDIVEEMGRQLSLKIDWTEEVNFGSMFEGFAGNRYDAICGPIFPTPARARAADFTLPVFYSAENLYVRADDKRFDANRAAINTPKTRFAALDGEFSAIIAREDYPQAQYVSVPQLSDASQILMSVAAGKADITATDPLTANKFMAQNPGKLRRLPGPPARVLPVTLAIPLGDEKFKTMLNIASQSLLDTGFVERAVKNYPDADKTLLRIAKPYVPPPQ